MLSGRLVLIRDGGLLELDVLHRKHLSKEAHSLRNLSEMILERGFELTHETVR